MKVWGHYVPFRFLFYKCNLGIEVCTTLLVSQLPVCMSSYFCLYFDNWLTFNLVTSKKYDYYIWISKWQKCKEKNGLITHVCEWRKPSFTASITSPRMLFDATPWLKSTCCRFEFHLRKKPGRGKCILRSPVFTITWPATFDLCAKLNEPLRT